MSRRANGQGSKPYQQANGRWRAEIVTGWTADGKKIRKVVTARTQALCEDRLRELLNARDAGTLAAGAPITLGAWLEHWLTEIAGPALRPRTAHGYRSYINTWIVGTPLARTQLVKVTPEQLDALYARMRAAGRAPATVLQMHRILARAFKIATRRGRLGTSPTSRMDPPRGQSTFEARALTADEVRRLITAAGSTPGGATWMVAVALGLRQGERLGLGWDCVDLEAGTLEVKRAVQTIAHRHGCPDREACPAKRGAECPQRIAGGQVIGPPKSRAGSRVLALPRPLVDALKTHRAEQLAARAADWAPYTDPAGVTVDLVFCAPDGRPWNPRTDYARWGEFLAAAGLPALRVHDARHTAATALLLLGVEPRVVMELMGWSQVSMLARYQHVMDEVKRSTADAIGAAMWSAPPAPELEAGVVSLDAFRARRSG